MMSSALFANLESLIEEPKPKEFPLERCQAYFEDFLPMLIQHGTVASPQQFLSIQFMVSGSPGYCAFYELLGNSLAIKRGISDNPSVGIIFGPEIAKCFEEGTDPQNIFSGQNVQVRAFGNVELLQWLMKRVSTTKFTQ